MEKTIEVRSLDGRSVTISISCDRSIVDLKAKLMDSFLPAKNSPHFHLFFKGSKLSLDSRVGSHSIEHGEFMVLIPYIKKSQQSAVEYGQSGSRTPNVSTDRVAVSAADSTWHDIMNDLSSFSAMQAEITKTDNRHSKRLYCEEGGTSLGESRRKTYSDRACKRKLDDNHALHEVLCSDAQNISDKQVSSIIRGVLESVNCLSKANSSGCLLFEEYYKSTGVVQSCVCPSWLKRVLKIFMFVNIMYAFVQRQKKCFTWECIDKALMQSNIFGLENACMTDVKSLPLLCPKMIISLCEDERFLDKLDTATLICISANGQHAVRNTGRIIIYLQQTKKPQFHQLFVHLVEGVLSSCQSYGKLLNVACYDGIQEIKLASGMSLLLPLEESVLMQDVIAAVVSEGSGSVTLRKMSSLCRSRQLLEPAEMVEHLRKGIGKQGQLVHVEFIDAKEAVYAKFHTDLSEALTSTLKGFGITMLYSHQVESLLASLSGKNVVVATSTSSGKSLCYNIPVLEALSKNTMSCALYMFPTKALAQDQLRTLLKMIDGLNIGLNVGIYDGDTSQENRKLIRDDARLLITNPDMLHMSILPFHGQFKRILSNLRYVVIDETHTYKGAFGCHTAFILRRLQRICSHVYGSDPSFIFCTATSANPREHAMMIKFYVLYQELGNLQTLELVQNDGSPRSPKYFILWNPPLYLEQKAFRGMKNNNPMMPDRKSRRSSPILEVSYLLAEMVQHGLRCIAFCKTRKLCELTLCYTREILNSTANDLVKAICVYRAGYSPQERRRIEADISEGRILGVAATNALEVGIDIGHIDATIHLGFPGTVASLWQQAGRSGRRSRPSLAVYVAFEGPLDQYFMKFPNKLFGRPMELCQVDAHNQKVLEQHIACAAFELPLCLQYDEKYFGSGLNSAIISLRNKGYLCNDAYDGMPSRAVTIRAVETIKYKVVECLSNEVLEEIEESKAFFQFCRDYWLFFCVNKVPKDPSCIDHPDFLVLNCWIFVVIWMSGLDIKFIGLYNCLYVLIVLKEEISKEIYDGAVYMHQGDTYLVNYLDLSTKVAFCQRADLKYYTKTRDYTDVHVAGGELAYLPVKASCYVKTTAQTRPCTVTTKWFGFYRIWRSNNQIFDKDELSLPEFSFESEAVWICVSQSIKSSLEKQQLPFRPGLHAASHALLNVVPFHLNQYIMCNATDLATECVNPHEKRAFSERLLLYDRHPGGIGITKKKIINACIPFQVQLLFRELLTAALELVSTCNCLSSSGCPNCIQALSCSEYNEVLHKDAAILILKSVIQAEMSYFEGREDSSNNFTAEFARHSASNKCLLQQLLAQSNHHRMTSKEPTDLVKDFSVLRQHGVFRMSKSFKMLLRLCYFTRDSSVQNLDFDSVMDSVISKKILLPVSVLFLFLSCHVYFPSIDRKALFFFCNVILLFITTHSIVEVDETTKTHASPNYSKIEVIEIEPCLVEETAAAATTAAECSINRTEPEQVVQLEKPESGDAGSPCDASVEDGEDDDESMRLKISDHEGEVEEDQQRDELQEKIEAFIEKVKRQRRMEVLQHNVKEVFTRSE
ncbi:hypothetical protein ZIOFF_008953 [Zingiber officinale]|uniref:Uncharacterized protein n=1 Tax=Zingiber officinale TaxID=94328 RepID=A0A8J5IGU1_ZINOF|nr:hypothetical protein ZIOFF_008953 [Zingiber officinale]